MIQNLGKGKVRWLHTGTIFGSQVRPGDGITPSLPLSGPGLVVGGDIQVPAITGGQSSDWSVTYPGQYLSTENWLDLIIYEGPDDSTWNLHGKGNLLITDFVLMRGSGITGAAEPSQSANSIIVQVKPKGASYVPYEFNGTMPSGATFPSGVINPTSGPFPTIIGDDFGINSLVLRVQAITTNVAAGRWRWSAAVREV